MNEVAVSSGSPFDALRHVDERGEYWLAREIASPLGYTWRRFADAIERGRIALRVNNQDPDIHIELWTTPSIDPRASKRTDYRMTREGVDVTIQGGDPRKPEIAAGWAYYRGKTREAELLIGTPTLDPDLQRIYDLTVGMQQTRNDVKAIERAQKQMANELSDVAARVDGLEHHTGWYSALGYSRLKGLPTSDGVTRQLGTVAGKIGRKAGLMVAKVPDERYGTVNGWPEWVWDLAAGAVRT